MLSAIVNGAYRGNGAIGHLMHDFCTTDADNMYYNEITKKGRFHKPLDSATHSLLFIFMGILASFYSFEVVQEFFVECKNILT